MVQVGASVSGGRDILAIKQPDLEVAVGLQSHLGRHNRQTVGALHNGSDYRDAIPGRRLITQRRGSLAEERPDLVKQWVDEANKDATPDTVGASSCYRAT